MIVFIQNLTSSEAISYLIGITGILLSIVFYYRSKRIQEPRFLKSSAVITEEMISKESLIHIMFGDHRLERLTVTKIAFWNTGITLKCEDVSKNSPFRVERNDNVHQFIDCRVCYSEEENDVVCRISENKQSVLISFDYLAKDQGFVLKALHTGKGSASITVKGAMKNAGKLRKTVPVMEKFNSFFYRHISPRSQNIFFSYTFIVLGLVGIIISYFKIGSLRNSIEVKINDMLPYMLIGFACILLGILFQWGNMPRKIHKAFWDEF